MRVFIERNLGPRGFEAKSNLSAPGTAGTHGNRRSGVEFRRDNGRVKA
jgi:hypothetical protein